MCIECDKWRHHYSKPENMTNQCTVCRQYKLLKEFIINPITKKLKRTCNTCNMKFRCSKCPYTGAYRIGYERHLQLHETASTNESRRRSEGETNIVN